MSWQSHLGHQDIALIYTRKELLTKKKKSIFFYRFQWPIVVAVFFFFFGLDQGKHQSVMVINYFFPLSQAALVDYDPSLSALKGHTNLFFVFTFSNKKCIFDHLLFIWSRSVITLVIITVV